MSGLPSGARVFVTGATGLVGSHAATLLRERGHPVRALHRAGSDTRYLRALGCELVQGDVRDDPDALARAIEGSAAILHAAAMIYTGRSLDEVRGTNVGGTEHVLRAAARAGADRILHLSSVAVYGDPIGRPTETSPLDRRLGSRELYARSKREAEQRARELAVELGLSLTMVRAAALYGERDRLMTPKLAAAFRFPVQFLLGDGRATIPAVYAGNLADAAVRALATAGSRGTRVYDLGEDHPVTQRDIYEALARALGVRFRPVPLPRSLVLAGARAGDAIGIRIRGARELPLGRTARLALGPNPFGSATIRRELGWSPPFTLEQALDRTAGWVVTERRALGLPPPRPGDLG